MTNSTAAPEIEPLVVPGPVRSVVERWRTVVAAVGDRTALHSAESSYTFAEADTLSDLIATRLLPELPDVGTPVATFVDHSADGALALLTIIKTGRILVMLDPYLPLARLQQIAEQAGVTVCLTDERHADSATALGRPIGTVVRFDELLAEAKADRDASRILPAELAATKVSGSDPLAIVFTSGSTGLPKGVVQTHDGLLNDAYGWQTAFGVSPVDRVALVLPFSFAAGLLLFTSSLMQGAGVWIYDSRDGGGHKLAAWIAGERPTTFHCTPHLLRSLLGVLDTDTVMKSIRLFSTCGEAIHGRDVASVRQHLGTEATFVNWTGSSEVGTFCLYEIRDSASIPDGVVPAGLPVANKEVVLLREDGTVATADESGEVTIRSHYLSGGYWRDAVTSATKFTVDSEGRRSCHQGDIGRFAQDGTLVLLGRTDAAVKVRGYLVEPSEIEAAIVDSDAVLEAAVVALTNPPSPTRLVAYVVPSPKALTESQADLRRRLRARLPEYMIPSTIVDLDTLPRNERGKVDRQNLPPVEAQIVSESPIYPLDVAIGDIWAEVLGVDSVGLDDDFMASGGDSLNVEEMLAIVAHRLHLKLTTSDLLDAPTLRKFSARLGRVRSLPSHPDVITLRAEGTKPPLFCFAGAGNLALSFLPLSRHLDDHPVYAFQAHGLGRRGLPDWSIRSAARRYLELIKVIQPHGPYFFAGHSFGGLVALEIADQLVQAGAKVELVALLDTYQPAPRRELPKSVTQRAVERSERVASLGLTRGRVSAAIRRKLPTGLPGVRNWPEHGRGYLAGVVTFSGHHQYLAMMRQGMAVARRHRLSVYPGRVLLVLADGNPDGVTAWQGYLTGDVTTVELACEHLSVLREPHATSLASALAPMLG